MSSRVKRVEREWFHAELRPVLVGHGAGRGEVKIDALGRDTFDVDAERAFLLSEADLVLCTDSETQSVRSVGNGDRVTEFAPG